MIYERGQANGVPCEVVDRDRLRELEPHANALQAVHSPSTGIVDYKEVLTAMMGELVARGVGFGLRVVRGELLFVIRRAAFAQSGRGVPTDVGTDPFAAARALMEMLLGLFDRDGEGIVVGCAADGALDFISALPRASQNAPEDVSGGAKHV